MTHGPSAHYPYLDGLRGFAILLVLIGHGLAYSMGVHAAGPLAGTGVMVFFVLSGFLITDILVRERARTGSVSLKRFYLRRTLRIFPAYYALLAITWLLSAASVTPVADRELLICAAYARNIFGSSELLGHAWSLSLEEQFYLVWPALFLLLPAATGRAALLTALIVVCILALRTSLIVVRPDDIARGVFYMRPWFRFDSLLIGCALALWVAHGVPPAVSRALRLLPAEALLLALVGWSVTPWPAAEPVRLTVEMLLAGALLLRLRLHPTGLVARLFQTSALGTVGKLSYSLYLWQQLFLVTTPPQWTWLESFPARLACLVACALGSYLLIERPFLRLKERLGRTREAAAS